MHQKNNEINDMMDNYEGKLKEFSESYDLKALNDKYNKEMIKNQELDREIKF